MNQHVAELHHRPHLIDCCRRLPRLHVLGEMIVPAGIDASWRSSLAAACGREAVMAIDIGDDEAEEGDTALVEAWKRGSDIMAELITQRFEAAEARGEERLRGPRAERAHYDAGRDRVIVRLTTGVEIGFAPRDAEGLQHASREDLATVEVEAHGLCIHFPGLDADFYVPVLLEGALGPKSWMAARLG